MNDSVKILSMSWILVHRFTPRQKRWCKDSLCVMNDGAVMNFYAVTDSAEMYSMPWWPRFILFHEWWCIDSHHVTNDGAETHSVPWMMLLRLIPCPDSAEIYIMPWMMAQKSTLFHEWRRIDSFYAINDGGEIQSCKEWWCRDWFCAMTDSEKISSMPYTMHRDSLYSMNVGA
jgi:hypothetical protein